MDAITRAKTTLTRNLNRCSNRADIVTSVTKVENLIYCSTRKICFHQFGVQQCPARGAVKFLQQIVAYQLAHEGTRVRGWKRSSRAVLLPAVSELAKRLRALRATNPLGAGIRDDGQFLAKRVVHSGSLSSSCSESFSELLRCRKINLAIGFIDDSAVDVARRLPRDQTVLEVLSNQLRLALQGITIAATARYSHIKNIALSHLEVTIGK